MKAGLLVPFGLKAGKLYEPTQVTNGKACDCVCPACMNPLVAKQNAQTPHFAHAQDANCTRGFETAVHLAAKQIITDKMQVRIPAVIWNNPSRYQPDPKLIHIQTTIDLDSVTLEKNIGDFKPDIVVTAGSSTYLVEIAVTHFINDDKQQKIQRQKIPTFEVDVSSLKAGFTMENLEEALFSSKDYQAEWKYHPTLEQLSLEAKEAEIRQVQKEEEANQAFEKMQQERKEKFQRYRNLRPVQQLEKNLKSIEMTRNQMGALVKHVPWDDSFGVPREVWQSAVIAYIVKRGLSTAWKHSTSPKSIAVQDCLYWLQEAFFSKPKVPNGDRMALWKYFRHLEDKGILGHIDSEHFYILVRRLDWSGLDR